MPLLMFALKFTVKAETVLYLVLNTRNTQLVQKKKLQKIRWYSATLAILKNSRAS